MADEPIIPPLASGGMSDVRRAFAEYQERQHLLAVLRRQYLLTAAPVGELLSETAKYVNGHFNCSELLNIEPIHKPMNTNPALLAAICAEPAEDTPRLLYADWLDETADDAPAEFREGYRGHAELIRLQVNMARAPSCPVCKKLGRFRGAHKYWCALMGIDVRDTDVDPDKNIDVQCPRCGFYEQHNRIRSLLQTKYATEGRIPNLPPPKIKGEELWKPPELLAAKETRYVRGFVGVATFKLNGYLAWCDKAVRAAPLQAIYLSDKPLPNGPRVHGKIGYFYLPEDVEGDERAELETSPMVIPQGLWELAHDLRTKDAAETKEDCYAWLCMACVTFARNRANLPALTPPAAAIHGRYKPGFPAFLFEAEATHKLPDTVSGFRSDGLYTQYAIQRFAEGDPDLLEYKGFCDARLLDRFREVFGVLRFPEAAPLSFIP